MFTHSSTDLRLYSGRKENADQHQKVAVEQQEEVDIEITLEGKKILMILKKKIAKLIMISLWKKENNDTLEKVAEEE